MTKSKTNKKVTNHHKVPDAEKRLTIKVLVYLSQVQTDGSFTSDRFEIDTTLSTTLAGLGEMFRYWKIHWLHIEYVAAKGKNAAGQVGIGIIEDPGNGTVISSMDQIVENRYSTLRQNANKISLKYTPEGAAARWLFTKDALTLEDRLEMPGEIVFGFEGFDTSGATDQNKALITIDVSFKGISNFSTANKTKIVSPSKDITQKIDELASEKLKKLIKEALN